jgi:hypothetical protein
MMKNTRFSLALFSLPLSLGSLGALHTAAAHAEAGSPSAYSKPSPLAVAGKTEKAEKAEKSEKIAEANAQRELRRIELRAALLANKKKSDDATRASMRDYHLNAQELAEMRQQLSQQLRQTRIEGDRTKP